MEPSWLPTLSSFAEITSQSFWSPALLFALAAANLLALSLAAYLIYSHFLRRRRLRYRKICTLEISNLGNIPARYALRFTQEVKTVKVGFRLEGETLPAWEEPAAAGSARSPAWAQTPALAAGGTLALEVVVDPLDPYQARWYPLTIHSRCLSAEGLLLPEPISNPIVDPCEVHIAGGTRGERYGEIALAAAVSAFILLFACGIYFLILQPLIAG